MTESKLRQRLMDLLVSKEWSGPKAVKEEAFDLYCQLRDLTHPEAQGNKDLGESPLARLEVRIGPYDCPAEKIATEARGRFIDHQRNPPATNEMLGYTDFVAMVAYEFGINRSSLQAALAAAPTLLIKGESELESASNGMGLR